MLQFSPNLILVITIASVMGVVSVGLLIFLKKEEIRFVRLGLWILYYFILFGFLGFIATKIQPFPTAFWVVEGLSLLMGISYLWLAPRTLSWWKIDEFAVVFLTAEAFICWGILGLSLVFGLISKQSSTFLQYLILGVLPFLLPLFFMKAYQAIITIPDKKYKRWIYPEHKVLSEIEPVEIVVITIKFTKIAEETESFEEKQDVSLPRRLALGHLFHYFINFYNNNDGENLGKKIHYKNNGQFFEWEFYRINSLNQRVYLDHQKSLLDNGINSKDVIYAVSFIN